MGCVSLLDMWKRFEEAEFIERMDLEVRDEPATIQLGAGFLGAPRIGLVPRLLHIVPAGQAIAATVALGQMEVAA